MRRIARWTLMCLIVSLLFAMSSPGTAEPLQQYDFEGRTVSIAFRFFDVTPLGERGQFNWLDPDPRLSAHIAEVEAMFNVTLEFIRHPGDAQILTSYGPNIIAGDHHVSVVEADLHSSAQSLIPLAVEGYIWPLDDLLDEAYYESLPPSFRSTEGYHVHGALYGFEPLNSFTEPVGILWNKDLFEREGLPDLYELYRNGEWTYDVFAEIALEMTMDTTGDGETDFYGVDWIWERNNQVANFIYSNDASLTRTVDGRVVTAFDAPEAVEALQFLQDLYLQGALAPAAQGTRSSTNAAMSIGSPHILQFPHFQNVDDLFGYVPLPKGPNAADYVHPYWNRWMAVVMITEPDPRGVIEITNALRQLTEPYMGMSLEEWEDRYWNHWGGFMADRESMGVWQEASVDRLHTDNRSILFANGMPQAINAILNEGASVATTMSALAPRIQAALDEVFGTD